MERSDGYMGRGFPTIAGIFLGLGLGGFFDGIILHQVLQWHHLFTSVGFPQTLLETLSSMSCGMAFSILPLMLLH